MYKDGFHTYHIYILTNKTKSVLYTGVTNYLARRLSQHSENISFKANTFAAKYKCKHLLYYEKFTWIQEAIAREKEIKGWRRSKKIDLIKTINPNLNFLEYLFPYETP
jgi:putative endonuclease